MFVQCDTVTVVFFRSCQDPSRSYLQ